MDYQDLPAGHLPDDPMPYVMAWLRWANADTRLRNPNAMALASANTVGTPSVRMVLLKSVDPQGFGVFYTHYESPKSEEFAANGRGAGVLYWDALGRQLRLAGQVVRSPNTESDQYFATRPALSQLNALVSKQSQPITDPGELERRSEALAADHGLQMEDPTLASRPATLARPQDWGGYRLWFESIELWAEGKGRFHDRICFQRELQLDGPIASHAGPWQPTRLQP